ncbi:hexapeptide transferase [Synechococcus sp. Minos11]|uniref:acyltransferase n=1 Tax=Synechococcus sp. Minos11 TaxID=221341 RepID=UPI001645E262|nr:acyltransferase [Synechococcus sp. Minos11]QNJ07694.1 hexapeptide transferase [Synechococcus sp. Minos11]
MVAFIKRRLAFIRLLRHADLAVSASSLVSYERISLKRSKFCSLFVCNNSLIDANIVFERDHAQLSIGTNTFMGGCTLSIAQSVYVGSNVQIAWGVTIMDHNSHSINYQVRRSDLPDTFNNIKTWHDVRIDPVFIADDVWIGLNAIILPGVSVGPRSIVAAGAVVTRNVPPATLVAGNPATVVKCLK